jgi:DNA-binding MarR family transcriptional regulator
MPPLSEYQYCVLLTFRTAVREFLHWSAEQAEAVGLSAQQHQLLLAVRAHPGDQPPSISDLAGYLLIRHHSTVGLVNRVVEAGLVERRPDQSDQRVIRVVLTTKGKELIEKLSEAHLRELEHVAEQLGISEQVLEQLARDFAESLTGQPMGSRNLG